MFGIEDYMLTGVMLLKQIAEAVSIVIIGAGIAVSVYNLVRPLRLPDVTIYNTVRIAFSRYLVLALEFELAADRTLMAWIRTSVSMISFGFTIYKFFQYLHESNVLTPGMHVYGPRSLGEVLVILGTVLMGFALVEYVLYQRLLSRQAGRKFPVSTTLIGALLMAVLGFLALSNLLFRIGPL